MLADGQETAVGDEPEPIVVDVELELVLVVVVVLGGVQSGSWYTVRRLPDPQNSVVSLAQSMLQSVPDVILAPAAN